MSEFALCGALNDFVVTCKIKDFPECHLWYFMCGLSFFPLSKWCILGLQGT